MCHVVLMHGQSSYSMVVSQDMSTSVRRCEHIALLAGHADDSREDAIGKSFKATRDVQIGDGTNGNV